MKVDWNARIQDILAQAPKAFQRGVRAADVVTLLAGHDKSYATRLLNRGVQFGLLFASGSNQDKRYFLTAKEAQAFKSPVKRCLPAARPRTPPRPTWKAEVAHRPPGLKVQKCPSNHDTRYSPEKGHQGEFGALGIGRYV